MRLPKFYRSDAITVDSTGVRRRLVPLWAQASTKVEQVWLRHGLAEAETESRSIENVPICNHKPKLDSSRVNLGTKLPTRTMGFRPPFADTGSKQRDQLYSSFRSKNACPRKALKTGLIRRMLLACLNLKLRAQLPVQPRKQR